MKLIVILFGILFSLAAGAGVYKCTDEAGRIVYKANPCATGQSNVEIDLKTGIKRDLDREQKERQMQDEQEQAKLDAQQEEEKSRPG
ncbi:DUF4124 domain-containing protein [Methylomicrobium agile]|uniref:DUF4124 domain-containing protein n=1 Tax=Methylomicrobium agile TaxID=39774 RepID=UPI000A75AE06|nr:DUF4124 domain-containing protein [Methylomicrobium agile]